MPVCLFVRACVCVCVCVCVVTFARLCVYLYLDVFVNACVDVCVCVCARARVYVAKYPCVARI